MLRSKPSQSHNLHVSCVLNDLSPISIRKCCCDHMDTDIVHHPDMGPTLGTYKGCPTDARTLSMFYAKFRKLEKAMAVCGMRSGVAEENSGKVPGKLLEKFCPKHEMLHILGFRAPGRQTCREPWVDTARDLVPTFRAGCFSKSTVPAFSSFSDRCLGFLKMVADFICDCRGCLRASWPKKGWCSPIPGHQDMGDMD